MAFKKTKTGGGPSSSSIDGGGASMHNAATAQRLSDWDIPVPKRGVDGNPLPPTLAISTAAGDIAACAMVNNDNNTGGTVVV